MRDFSLNYCAVSPRSTLVSELDCHIKYGLSVSLSMYMYVCMYVSK